MVLYSFVKAYIRKAYFGSKFKYPTTIQTGIVLVLCSNIQSSILSWIQNPSNWMLKEVSTNGEEMSITYGKFCFTCENVSTNLILRTLSTLKQLICKYIVPLKRQTDCNPAMIILYFEVLDEALLLKNKCFLDLSHN